MAGPDRIITVRGVALAVLIAVALLSVVVVVHDMTSSPEGVSIPTATVTPTSPTTPLITPLPSTGRVIGVLAIPSGWTSLQSPGLPFTMGYPPGWRVQQISTYGSPTVILANAHRRRTLIISGRRFVSNGEAHDALVRLAVTPVSRTYDPPIFMRSFLSSPSRGQVTTVVAFAQAGRLWTARIIQGQDMHLPEGLHELQAMLATFRTR